MEKKKGFIATSLIYSFFLVFIAILVAILNNYIANKIILLRYNEDALHALNTKVYSVSFIVYGAEAKTSTQISQAFSNLVQNGDFRDTTDWQKEGTLDFTATSFTKNTAQLSSVAANSYIYQSVPVTQDEKYYFSIEYSQSDSKPRQVFVDPEVSLTTQDSLGVWNRKSSTFYAKETRTDMPFVVGLNDQGYENTYFTNAMLINLTAHFGYGNEPSARWIDENLEFFNGTINYLKENEIKGNNELELTMRPQSDYASVSYECRGVNDLWYSTYENIESVVDTSGERTMSTLKIKNITDDIRCVVRWSE